MENPISLIINGQTVLGSITHLSSYNLTIKIVSPFSGYSHCRHVPTFARAKRNLLEDSQNLTKVLLQELYSDLLSLSAIHQRLAKQPVGDAEGPLFATLRQFQNDRNQLLQHRQLLKKQFRSQKLSQKEYRSKLKAIREQNDSLERSRNNTLNQFIDTCLPGWNYSLDHNQIAQFLLSPYSAEGYDQQHTPIKTDT